MKGVIEISKYSNTVEYNLRTKVDTSGVIQLQKQFVNLNAEITKLSSKKIIDDKQVAQARKSIETIQNALSSSFNSTLGIFDLSKFQKSLDGLSLGNLQKTLEKVPNGTQAFNNMLGTIGQMDTKFKSISSTVDKMFNTFGNTVRWGITASIFQSMQNDLGRAVEYVKELDTSLNNIRIVSGMSAQQMRDFSLYANEAAKNLGQSTTAFTDAALIFIQQGLDMDTSKYLGDLTLRMANVTQQDTATASEQITSIMNGYNMTLEETTNAIDVLANVAAQGASDMEELATAESRVAATASTLGVSQEQLAAQISTIISVTRQAPEVVGNALRSIYSRLADLKLGDTLEDGVDLGRFSSVVESVGVEVLDATGNLRNMGDIIEDLMVRWQDLSSAQQISVGKTLAGTYQLNQFLTLMSNMDMYNEQLAIAEDSAGTLEEQQSIYMDSMAAKLGELTAASETFITTLFNPDDWKPTIELATSFLEILTDMAESMGGLAPLMTMIASSATKIFSRNLAAGITSIRQNTTKRNINASNDQIRNELFGLGASDASLENLENNTAFTFLRDTTKYRDVMTTEQKEQVNAATIEAVQLENEYTAALKASTAAAGEYSGMVRKARAEREALGLSVDPENPKVLSASVAKKTKQTGMAEQRAELLDSISGNIESAIADIGSSSNIDDIQKAVAQELGQIDMAKYVGKSGKKSKLKLFGGKSALFEFDESAMKEIQDATQRFFDSTSKGADETRKAGENLIQTLQQQSQTYRGIVDQNTKVLEENDRIQSGLDAGREKARVTGQRTASLNKMRQSQAADRQRDIVDNLDFQSKSQAVLTLASSVGQLAFSWMSFQQLGSLIADDNMTGAEKFTHIIMNLAMTFPMLIDSFNSLNQAFQTLGIGKIIDSTLGFNEALELVQGTGGKLKTTLHAAFMSVKSSIGATATSVKALISSMGPLLAIAAAIGTVSAVMGYMEQQEENRIQAIEERATEAQANVDSIASARSNFDTLYEAYQQGEASSDQLKEAADALNEVLDNQSLKVQAATENWEAYSNTVAAAAKEEAQQNYTDLAAQTRQKENEFYNAPGYFGSGFGSSIFKGEKTEAALGQEGWEVYTGQNALSYNAGLDQWHFRAGTSGYERLAAQDVMEEYFQSLGDNMTEDQEKAYESFQAYTDQYASQAQALRDAYDAEVQAALQAFGDEEAFQYNEGDTMDEYVQQLMDTGKFASEDMARAFAEGMMGLNTDTSNALATQAGVETANEAFSELLGGKAKSEIDEGAIQYDFGEGVSSSDAAAALTQDIQNRYDALTDEQKIELVGMLDEDATIQEIYAQIEQMSSSENFELEANLTFRPEYTNRVDETEERTSETLEESGISENAFNRMASAQFDQDEGYFADAKSSILSDMEAIENGSKSFDEVVEGAEDAEDALQQLRDEYTSLADEAKDVTAQNIRMNQGVEDLADVWEEYGNIITDDASKGTADYYEAIGQLDEAMSDILNIDVGTLSNDFYENAEAVEAMGRAAEGDMSAIDDLHNLAAQDIITHMEIAPVEGMDAEATRAELLSLQQELQAQLDATPLEARADVDVSDYTNKLNQMILDGQITAEQASSALSSMGISGELTYVDATGQVPIVTYTRQGDASIQDFIDGKSDSFSITSAVTGYTEVPMKVPQFTGTHYTGSGISGIGSRSAGRSGGGGGGSGKKGGGGGSGSSKKYEPKTKDPVKDELDRYERVDTQLDALGNDFEKIADEQDRLLGDDLAKNMAKQIDLLKEQVYWQQEKLEIQKDEAAEYRNQLASQYGVTFNDEGFITNYADRYKAYLNNLNNLINQYNATTTEAGQEALDKQIEDAQEAFDEFNDLIDNYDDLISNQIKDSEAQIESFYDQIEDLQIEAFNRVVETVDNIKDIQETLIDFNAVFSGLNSDSPFREMTTSLEKLKKYWDVGKESMEDYYDSLIAKNNEALKRTDLSEAQRNWLQYQNEVLQEGKAAYGQGTLEAGGTGYLDMELSNLNTIIGQITQFEQQGFASIFGENESALFETAKEIFDSATSMIEDYEDEVDNLRDAILDAIDEIGERIDDRLEQYQNINDELEHYGSLIEMLHGENAYDELNQALSAQVNNNQSQILVIKESIEILKDMQSAMEEGSEEWKAVQEQINDKQSELLDKTEETMEQLVEIYQNGVNKALDAWTADSPLGSDLDWVSDEWELINRNADYYLDDVNAAYNIQKLQGKYLELLDGTDDLLIQQQITNQMNQQLQYLREKNNLSQYDVDYANAQLEILQRTIALQEAQRNKSQLQLRRDTQGNYNYVYTANEGDIASAQGDLLDAQNNAYNLSKDQIKQTQDDSLSALQDAKNMLNDLWTDANLTLEEKTKRTQTIIDSLKEYLAGTGEQLSTAETNIINDFIGMCELLTDENRTNLEDVYNEILQGNNDAFDQIDTRWSTSLTQWLQNLTDFNEKTDEAFDNLVNNYESYQESLDELSEAAGTNFDDLTSHINNANDATAALNQTSQDFMTTIRDDAGVIKSYENQLAEMTAKIQDADNAMKAYQEQVNDLAGKLTAKEQENANLSNRVQELEQTVKNYEQYGNANGAGGGGGSGSGGVKGDSATAWGIAQAIWTYGSRSGWGNDPIRSSKLTNAFGSAFAKQVQQIINQNTRNGKLVNYDSMKYSSYNLIGYDTGGYTGNFSDPSGAGRLAILHSKELVLNESDTKNILQAVEAVRNLTTNFRNGAFENAVEALSNYGSEMLMSSIEPQDLEQNVHIEANFPNVVGAEEVERALLNLTNTAMQYANRNGRNPVNSNGSFS